MKDKKLDNLWKICMLLVKKILKIYIFKYLKKKGANWEIGIYYRRTLCYVITIIFFMGVKLLINDESISNYGYIDTFILRIYKIY